MRGMKFFDEIRSAVNRGLYGAAQKEIRKSLEGRVPDKAVGGILRIVEWEKNQAG